VHRRCDECDRFKEERLAWTLLGLAPAVWTVGEIYLVAVLANQPSIPVPSPADAGYLLFYPLAYAGLIILVRRRLDSFSAARWLDGIMRKHTLIGERIIAAAPALVPIARLVRSSHERWDGGGYPDGLAGEMIPLGSRIVFCCDAFDAMVSERPYSVAMRPTRALEVIGRGAGSQFDPTVAVALRAVVLEWHSGGDGDRRLRAEVPGRTPPAL
jgi:hypothetical protein